MPSDPADAVFEALAEPTRRRLLQALSEQPATATELAARFPITRQAVTKHLSSLTHAGLLVRERSGREIRYRLHPEPLTEAMSWMADVGEQWDQRLARLGAALEEPAGPAAPGPPGPAGLRDAPGPVALGEPPGAAQRGEIPR